MSDLIYEFRTKNGLYPLKAKITSCGNGNYKILLWFIENNGGLSTIEEHDIDFDFNSLIDGDHYYNNAKFGGVSGYMFEEDVVGFNEFRKHYLLKQHLIKLKQEIETWTRTLTSEKVIKELEDTIDKFC